MLKKIFVKKIPKFIFIFTVLMITLIFLYSYIQENSRPILSEKETFDKTNLEVYVDKANVLQQALAEGSGYWDTWSWEEKIIETDVVEIDFENKELALRVRRPREETISRKIIRPYITCSPEETIAVDSKNPTVSLKGGGFELFEKIEEGDLLMTYCLDEECLNIGKLCILVKM